MQPEAAPVTITIDGRDALVDAGITILEASRQHGIHIPTLCHHPALSERGGCRMCVVEVDGAPRLAASCVTPVRAGMQVVTTNTRIIDTRRTVLEFLFAERNHNCMICPRSGDCELQALAYALHMDHLTVPQSFRAFPVDFTGESIGLDHNRCVLCGRCVRACEEISGCQVLNFQNRGPGTLIGFDLNETRETSSCTSCGACLQVCPTGALYHRHQTHYAVTGHSRAGHTVQTVCPLCGLLCPTVATIRDAYLLKIDGVIPARDDRPDGGQLCRAGRFDVLELSDRRLLHPMVRQTDGSWAEMSQASALDIVVERLNSMRRAHGGQAVMGFCSGLSSNEELVCFRDLMVNAWQTGRVTTSGHPGFDTIYRIGLGNGRAFVETSWKKIPEADFVLIVGADARDSQPVLGAMIRKRLIRHQMRSAVIGPRDCQFPYGTYHLRVENGDALWMAKLMFGEAVGTEPHMAVAAGDGRTFEPREPAKTTETIVRRHLDHPDRTVLRQIARAYLASANPLIVVAAQVAAQADPFGWEALLNLARLKANADPDTLRLILLKPSGNSMGAYHLLPRPGRRHCAPTPPKGALMLLEQAPGLAEEVGVLPGNLDFLAVIAPCWSDSLSDRAHVLIPKPAWMESDGSYTSLDGRETAFRARMLDAPEGVQASWQTLAALAARANAQLGYATWEALRQRAQKEMDKEASGAKA